MKHILPLALAACILGGPARGDIDELMAGCIDPYPDLRIGGCTRAIESGVWSGGDLAWAYNNRGIAHRLLGNWEKALADMAIAIGLDPENAVNWNTRGHALRLMGRPEEAIRHFDWAVVLDPTHRLAVYNRATAYMMLGRHAEAATDYSVAIRLDPADPWAWNDRGLARHRMGELEAALGDFDAALERRPGLAATLNNRGNTLCRIGNVEAAIADWAAASEADPDFARREQEWLALTGFYEGEMTGTLDPATLAAQRAYAEAGCPDPPETPED